MSTRPAFTDTLRGEWIKFRSLRSTWLTVGGLVVVGLGLTLLSMDPAAKTYLTGTAEEQQAWDPTNRSLLMYFVAQLIIGVLGVLVVTSEYATGLVQTSLSATPRRHRLLGAKVAVVTAVALVAGQALMFAAFLIGQAGFAAAGVTADDGTALLGRRGADSVNVVVPDGVRVRVAGRVVFGGTECERACSEPGREVVVDAVGAFAMVDVMRPGEILADEREEAREDAAENARERAEDARDGG